MVLGDSVEDTLRALSNWSLVCSWKPWLGRAATLQFVDCSRDGSPFLPYRQACLGEHTTVYEMLPLYSRKHQRFVRELPLHSDNWNRCDFPHMIRHPEVEL